MVNLRLATVWIVAAGVSAGCQQDAQLVSVELGETQQAMCVESDGVHAVMAALAVSTAMEVGRWEPLTDFVVSRNALELSSTGSSRCAEGGCWNTRAILDLQRAEPGEVQIGDLSFDPRSFRRRLVKDYRQQLRCEAQRGKHEPRCDADPHELRFASIENNTCRLLYTFDVLTPEGDPLETAFELSDKLVFAGYPENPYLEFSSSGTTVTVDPTYGLNEDGSSTGGSCSASCTKISSSNLTGQCCVCNGATRTYVQSTFSTMVYMCR